MRWVLGCVFVLVCTQAMAVDFYEVNPTLVNEVARSGSAIIVYKTGASEEVEKLCYKAGFTILQRSTESHSLLCKAPVPSVLQLRLAELLSSPAVERVEPNAVVAAGAPPKQIAKPAPQPTPVQARRDITGILREEFQDLPGSKHQFMGYTLEARVRAGTPVESVDTLRLVLSNNLSNLNLQELVGQEITVTAETGQRSFFSYLYVTQVKAKQPVKRLEKPITKPATATNIQVRAR